MKSFALALALGLVLVSLSFGSPIQCSTIGTYAGLVATGSSGCLIGDKLFSDFVISGALNPGGTDNGSAVTVGTVNEGLADIGFTFGFDQSLQGGELGSSLDTRIGYLIQTVDGSSLIESAALNMLGVTSGGGIASIVEEVCVGDDDKTCETGTPLYLNTILGTGNDIYGDSVQFRSAVSEVYDYKDINIIAGPGGYASISVVTETVDQVGSVPEPATMGLGVLGILLGLGIKRFNRA
jgi:hypothetical protein